MSSQKNLIEDERRLRVKLMGVFSSPSPKNQGKP
jgi:hypothetical protein